MHATTTRENQEIVFIPTNEVSDTIWYRSQDSDQNQRLIVDVPNEHPNVWQVSKVEKVNVRLRTKLTLYQHEFDQHTDYLEKDDDGNIVGMYADYYINEVEPIELEKPLLPDNDPIHRCELSATNNVLKVGGSYKLLTATIYNAHGDIVTEEYTAMNTDCWKFYVDGTDITDSGLVTILEQNDFNKVKIKFANDKSYLTKVLTVKCIADDANGVVGEIQFELRAL